MGNSKKYVTAGLLALLLLLGFVIANQQKEIKTYRTLLSETVTTNITNLSIRLDRFERANHEADDPRYLADLSSDFHYAAFEVYDNLSYAYKLGYIDLDTYDKGYLLGSQFFAIHLFLTYIDRENWTDEEAEKIKLIRSLNGRLLAHLTDNLTGLGSGELNDHYRQPIVGKEDFWYQRLLELQEISEAFIREQLPGGRTLDEYLN
ncbi:hypothetical protein M3212_05495 [Alkalihalobacillus oceani]|uniref:hypothetical protein n=1 Tax=Halalkalibacter oceani TaxID=1653776 RepID=UPI0020408764|nr:hypothetical protein [Halalkalibacter oceani]MCM3760242.1 hypothetical protein [Halalkalibacter oceani]